MLFLCFTASDWATLIGALLGALIGVAGSLYVYQQTVKHEKEKDFKRKVEYLDAACCLLNEICSLQEDIFSGMNQYVVKVKEDYTIAHPLTEVPLSLFSRFKSLNTEVFLNAWIELKLDNKDYVLLYNSFDFINSTTKEIYTSHIRNNTEICTLRKGLLHNRQNKLICPMNVCSLSDEQIIQSAKDINTSLIEHIQVVLPKLSKAFDRISTIKCTICKTINKLK